MKSRIRYILILAFLVFISFYYGGVIKKNILWINDVIIGNFYNLKEYVYNNISKHFNQAEQISYLKKRNQELENSSILATTFANELNRLLEDRNSTQYFPRISLVRAISYVQINDYKRVWLDLVKNYENKNRGLIYKGFTAGISINKDGRVMALLQGDDQCVFSVYIGKDKVPGLIQGRNGKIYVNFIPKWAKIKIGDEILTSGLDGIFFAGIPVGVITKINDEDMYQSAEIDPYAKINIPAYFYIVDNL